MKETTSPLPLDEISPAPDLESKQDVGGDRPVAKDARAVANYFLAKAEDQDKSLTPMQLIKLVYIAHGWHLAWHDRPLIGDDVEAWRHGPVIANVFHAFKRYGRAPIKRPTYGEYDLVIDIGILGLDDKVIKPKPLSQNFPSETKEVMDEILKAYGGLTGIELSRMTHMPGSPWESTYRENENRVIENDIIKTHFLKLVQENNEFLEQVS